MLNHYAGHRPRFHKGALSGVGLGGEREGGGGGGGGGWTARLDEGAYPDKVRVSDADLAAVDLHAADFHPEWN